MKLKEAKLENLSAIVSGRKYSNKLVDMMTQFYYSKMPCVELVPDQGEYKNLRSMQSSILCSLSKNDNLKDKLTVIGNKDHLYLINLEEVSVDDI